MALQHFSFHDPFVFLIHSNVDRLWAMWQEAPCHRCGHGVRPRISR
ncbi:MAG: tyrosinase family protein [Actinomycetota bacterium]|nr:tyrosinase family protein [Actinomycetota bacterium]